MFLKKVVVTLVAMTAVVSTPFAGHTGPLLDRVIDVLYFLDKLNPFEQESLQMIGLRNDSPRRSEIEGFPISVNLTGSAKFVRQNGDLNTIMTRFNNNGRVLAVIADFELHPASNWDILMGVKLWDASASSYNFDLYASGFPVIGRVHYSRGGLELGFELGFDVFNSFTVYEDMKKEMEGAMEAKVRELIPALDNMQTRNWHTRVTFRTMDQLGSNWELGAGGVLSFRGPLPRDQEAFRKVTGFDFMREAIGFDFMLIANKHINGVFPFMSWNISHYIAVDFEAHRMVGVGLSASEFDIGGSAGISVKATMPYVTIKTSASLKIMQKRNSAALSIQFNFSQW